jgi:hypothetical protein
LGKYVSKLNGSSLQTKSLFGAEHIQVIQTGGFTLY